MKKPKVIAIIPARYASTRLHAKALIDLCGKPMIQHVYERTRQAALIDRVIVATDHEMIVEAVRHFGGEVIMTPAELKSGSDRIAFAAKSLDDADIVVNVQGDEPLIEPQMIDQAVIPLIHDPGSKVNVGTVVKRIRASEELWNPNIVKAILDAEGNVIYFSRSVIPFLRDNIEKNSWHLHHAYYKHFGLYVYRKEFLLRFSAWNEASLERVEKLEQLRIIENGYRIKTVVTEFDTIPVDTAEDADRVRKVLEQEKVGNS